MNVQCSFSRTLLCGLFAMLTAMVSLTSVAQKTTDTNTSTEPGDGCEAARPEFVCSPIVAPMGGDAAVTFITTPLGTNIARFSGRVEQFGSGECFIDASQDLSSFIPDKKTFNNLRARDVRGFCLQEIVIEGLCPFAGLSFAEVVDATQLIKGENIHKFDVLVLPLNCILASSP